MAELTELQRDILKEKRDNPDDGPKEIADRLECSESHAYRTLNNYDTARITESQQSSTSGNSESGGTGDVIKWIIAGAVFLIVWARAQGII